MGARNKKSCWVNVSPSSFVTHFVDRDERWDINTLCVI